MGHYLFLILWFLNGIGTIGETMVQTIRRTHLHSVRTLEDDCCVLKSKNCIFIPFLSLLQNISFLQNTFRTHFRTVLAPPARIRVYITRWREEEERVMNVSIYIHSFRTGIKLLTSELVFKHTWILFENDQLRKDTAAANDGNIISWFPATIYILELFENCFPPKQSTSCFFSFSFFLSSSFGKKELFFPYF